MSVDVGASYYWYLTLGACRQNMESTLGFRVQSDVQLPGPTVHLEEHGGLCPMSSRKTDSGHAKIV